MVKARTLIPLTLAFGGAGLVTAWSIQKEHPITADILKFVSIGWPSAVSLFLTIERA